jgi:hypothetical protein
MKSWDSISREYSTPEGDVFITCAFEKDLRVHRLWVWAGKTGTITYATADALGAAVGTALRHGVPPLKMARGLLETTHEDSRLIGYEAKSVPDAVGRFIRQHLDPETADLERRAGTVYPAE